MSNDPQIPKKDDQPVRGSWPPAPTQLPKVDAAAAPAAEHGELTHCPHCRHRLLTHRSVLCNWCGKPINDKTYLEKAAAERAAVDAAMRESLARLAAKPEKKGLISKIVKKADQLLQND